MCNDPKLHRVQACLHIDVACYRAQLYAVGRCGIMAPYLLLAILAVLQTHMEGKYTNISSYLIFNKIILVFDSLWPRIYMSKKSILLEWSFTESLQYTNTATLHQYMYILSLMDIKCE